MQSEEFDTIDEFARKSAFQTKAPGMVTKMSSPDGQTHTMCYGFRDLSKKLPMTERTCFAIGSISKVFTATIVLSLCEEGILNLNSPVSNYYKELKGTLFDSVTLHHLLSNTSGISTLGYAERSLLRRMGRTKSNFSRGVDEGDDLLDSLRSASEWVISEPGEKFTYLNEGYSLLSRLIERVTDISYVHTLENRIF